VAQTDLWDALCTILGDADAPRPDLVTQHSLREARSSLKVLLAEDNPVNVKLATRLLQKRGHKVVVAGNGREALELLDSAGPFDAVLMDVQMPVLDGLEATAAIRAREAEYGGHLRILGVTAHAMEGDRQRCLEAGMDGYLSKPFVAKDLFALLEE
jgi:CheY-like chemotaxis protein